jgi:large subunit ribosomal protein L4
MQAPIYNLDGEKIGKTELPSGIFGLKFNPDLVWQVVVSQMANKRKTIAHTKTRAEVSGGGRKPWPQKGLGRARHGSIRSPLWRHGGIVFGPRKERVFKKKIPKKMKRKALFMVLSQKLKDGEIILVKELKIEKPKTKIFFNILKKLPLKKLSALIALPKVNRNLVLASRNIPKVKTILAKDLNCLDLLSFKYLILPVDSIKVIEKTFLK